MVSTAIRFKYVDHAMRSALVLGCAALAANLSARLLFPQEDLPVGSLFLFWCAGALGPYPALVATGVGVFVPLLAITTLSGAISSWIPEARSVVPIRLLTPDYFEAVRTLILMCAVGYAATLKPRLPMFISVIVLWAAVLGPVTIAARSYGLAAPVADIQIASTAMAEILLAMISGTLLLNHSIWGSLRNQARRLTVYDLLLHIIPLSFTIIICLTLSVSAPDFGLINFGLDPQSPWRTMLFISACICAATILAWQLGGQFEANIQRFLAPVLLHSNAPQSFSGLSSEYWKRHSRWRFPRNLFYRRPDQTAGRGQEGSDYMTTECGICALTRNKTVAFLNQRFRAITELKDNEPLGKDLLTLNIPKQLLEAISSLVDRTFSKGPRTIELKLNQLPDKLRFVEISTQFAGAGGAESLVMDQDNVIVTIRDITDRRAVENHLIKGQRLASLANIVKGISHSFNNSLTAIIGQASAAQYLYDPSAVKNALIQIGASARQASILVRQLLDFAESHPGEPIKGDLGKLIHEHFGLFKRLVGENVELNFQPPLQPIAAVYEPNLILQAIGNILVNAKEAIGEPGGRITIILNTEKIDEEVADLTTGARPGEFARLTISDTGCGMNPEVLARAFEPCFTTKSATGNAGLGLSVVFGIVRSLDGFLCLESHLGRGTSVSIYLPKVELQADLSRPAAPNQIGTSQLTPRRINNASILVVEDDYQVREVVAGMLQTLGYQVTTSTNAAEALQKCAQSHFDLVLTDMVMPKVSGVSLIKSLRQEYRDTKTLVMTAYGVAQEDLCGAPILPKPFDIETLAQKVEELLNREDTVPHDTDVGA